MAKTKTARKSAGTSSDRTPHLGVVEHVTIQECKPSKFRIVLGEHDGIAWVCPPRGSTTIKDARKAFLKSINKTSTSFLTQEQIDDFMDYIHDAGIRVRMLTSNWKELFARRFRRLLVRKNITLKAQGFDDPVSKRWLHNLYKNGVYRKVNYRTYHRMCILSEVLDSDELDNF